MISDKSKICPKSNSFLHVGGLRTALYNYIFAKQNNGEFISTPRLAELYRKNSISSIIIGDEN